MTGVAFTVNQQKKVLRKKKSNKQTVKNVLSTSDELHWPLIQGDDIKLTKNALETYLPRVRPKKISIKYDDIKDLKKEERKAYRKKLCGDTEILINQRELIFGINSVTRLLPTKQIDFVLISNDVNPRFIVEGVVQSCLVNKIPFLVILDLRKILKDKCGLSSMVMGIRKGIEADSKLFSLINVLNEVGQKYQSLKEIVIEEDFMQEEENKFKQVVEPTELYLRRVNKCKRVFEPVAIDKEKQESDSMDYLSFRCEETTTYKPLIVKRVTNDPNRSKKKFKN